MMASFNCEAYIAQQIDSILAQEGAEIFLIISDDGSKDSTPQICIDYSQRFNNVIFRTNNTNKGVSENFMDMLYDANVSQYDYFAFADQDDIWLPQKLHAAIKKLSNHQEEAALYYSDVCNVDENLKNGRNEYFPFKPYAQSLETLLIVNWASGCTMVFNRKLAVLLNKIKPEYFPRFHDTWVHLVAMTCGITIEDLDNAYILRRITGKNQVGESRFGTLDKRRLKEIKSHLLRSMSTKDRWATNQAKLLDKHCAEYMDQESRETIRLFASMPNSVSARFLCAFNPSYHHPFLLENISAHVRMLINYC